MLDPSDLETVPEECIPEALGALEKARAALWARLITPKPPRAQEGPARGYDGRFLTAQEVAERLRTSRHWVYRQASRLGGIKVGGHIRFTEAGLTRYLDRTRKTR